MYLEYVKDRSKKSYDIKLSETLVIIQFGRIGKTPRYCLKDFDDEKQAESYYNKILNEKIKKGYIQKVKPLNYEILQTI